MIKDMPQFQNAFEVSNWLQENHPEVFKAEMDKIQAARIAILSDSLSAGGHRDE